MNPNKRGWLRAAAAAAAATWAARGANAAAFAGDEAAHKIVYQINRADPEYIEAILNSVGAVLGKYGDDVAVAIVAFGPGIHLLATQPTRPMPELLRQRVKGMAENYGVKLIACGNTLKALQWQRKDIIAQAEIQQVGAAAIMELQEKGYAYLAW